ncbi:MAG: DUF423 domain-containing protein [Acidobacteriota bacterium]
MKNVLLAVGPLMCAVAVLAGAFGAHGLKTRLDPAALDLWETASRYLMYGGLGVILVGLLGSVGGHRGLSWAGWLLVTGAIVFSGTVGALAVGAPRWLGAVTPIGGLMMIIGFLVFAWFACKL